MKRYRVASSCVLAVLLVSPTSVGAATQLGQVSSTASASCGAPSNVVQTSTTSGNPYAVPSGGGVITSWQHWGHPTTPGSGRFQVWDPRGGTSYALVGRSDLTAFGAGVLSDYAIRIPVSGDELLGLWVETGMFGCGVTQLQSVMNYDFPGVDPTPGETRSLAGTVQIRLNLSATLEPDADRDGFGDESQDQCPTDSSTQGQCATPDTDAPETTITKTPSNKSKKPTAKYKFTSDDPSATFECSLKGRGLDRAIKRFGDCASPRKYRGLDEGKFKFKVRAVDSDGNVDPSPAKDKFKVVG